jgi:hypothetical protein
MRITEKISKILSKERDILFAYIFGSYARGEARKESDIDIAIFLKDSDIGKEDPYFEVNLALEIEKETGLKNVEIVIIDNKPLRFLNQVLRYGKLIFSRDEKKRLKFETFITKSYIDFKPFYKEYDEMRVRRLIK